MGAALSHMPAVANRSANASQGPKTRPTPTPAYRSRTSTHGRNMAGARALWRATGMGDSDFGKPIIAIANSFTQFVPGHVHLKDLGPRVAGEIQKAGGVAKEFNTIAQTPPCPTGSLARTHNRAAKHGLRRRTGLSRPNFKTPGPIAHRTAQGNKPADPAATPNPTNNPHQTHPKPPPLVSELHPTPQFGSLICPIRNGRACGEPRLLTSERLYFLARLALTGLTAAVAIATLAFGWQSRAGGRHRYTGISLGVLLSLAAALSAYDAIDNVLVRHLEPITDMSWLWLFGFDLLLPLWAMLLIHSWRARDRAEIRLADMAFTDPVTSALNRRGFLDRAATALARNRRHNRPCALVMLDLDHFIDINDRYGHAAGDTLLQTLATAVKAELRATDMLGRIGGDEFVVLLPGCDAEAGSAIVKRWQNDLRAQTGTVDQHTASLTLSAGVAEISAQSDPATALTQACAEADAALYEAKRLGRDRAEIAPAHPSVLDLV
eukprot:gene18006-18243_t